MTLQEAIKFFKTGIENPKRDLFTLHSSIPAAAGGVTTTIFRYQTQTRPGAITGFKIDFNSFLPGTLSYQFKLSLDNVLIPESEQAAIFNYSDFISIPVNYSRYFDKTGQHIIQLTCLNNNGFVIYPDFYLTGFYIRNE